MLASTLPPDRLPISRNHDPFRIEGVDMRSQHGRRFRDLASIVIKDHGPNIDPVKVRELAGLKLSIEITQAALIAGDRKARNDLVRLLNHANRAERAMRDAKRAVDTQPAPLSAYLLKPHEVAP